MKPLTLVAAFAIASFLGPLVYAQTASTQPTTKPANTPTTRSASGLDANQQALLRSQNADSVYNNLNDAAPNHAGILKYGPVSLIDPYWRSINAELQKYGLNLGLAYTIVFQNPNGANRPAPSAVGGDFDLFANWRLLGQPNQTDNGYLNLQVEQRSSIGTDTAPKAIGGEIGSLWGTTNGFNEEPFVVKEVYWEQHFWADGLIVRAGKLDPTNYYDSNYWQSDSKFFMNQAFSSFPVRTFPSPGVGFNLKIQPVDWLSISTGLQNALGNGNLGELGNFWTDYSLFTATELDYTPKIPDMGIGNYRFTYWYRAATGSNGLPHDGGFDMSFDQQLGNVIPFFRYGYSENAISKISDMISTGIGYNGSMLSKADVVGIAFAWGKPSTADLRSQYATEVFYRLQVSPDNQFTVGYQVIIDPTNDPTENTVGVFELRWRLAL